jgi:peptidoglycan/LPS O-acetylase OafA/YrhL
MSSSSTAYRADIDGLRGIAVFCVVVFHAGLPGFSGGFVGVDIFFVISGFLICSIIEREIAEDRFSYATFYARRARRILPALFAVLLACFVVATLVLTGAELKDFSKSAVANIAAVSNIYFWSTANYFATASEFKPLMMTWSLSVEEQFYVFFPPVLMLIRRLRWHTGAVLAALTAASLLASVVVTARDPSTAFFLLPSRAWELGVGALLAHYHANAVRHGKALAPSTQQALGIVGLLGLVIAIALFDHGTPFPGIAAALPVVATAMLIAAPASTVNRRILGNRALVFIGLVSYSWYLWHWPLLSFARVVADQAISLTTALGLVGLSFVLAILSWRFIEQPFRAPGPSIRRTLWRYGAATASMLVIGMVLVAGRGWNARLPNGFAAIEQSGQVVSDPCLAGYGTVALNLDPKCVAAAGAAVALIGDSHAAALAPGLRAVAAAQGFGYTQFTKSSCPNLRGVSRLMLNHPLHDRECAAYNAAALQAVHDNPDIKVVFVAGYWSAPFAEEHLGQRFIASDRPGVSVTPEASRTFLRTGIDATVAYLAAAGKTVVLVKDVPMFSFNPVRAVAAQAIPARRQLAEALHMPPSGDGRSAADFTLTNRDDLSHRYIDEAGRHAPYPLVLDPAATLCTQGQCRYGDGSHLFYVDFQHLSTAGARFMFDQPSVNAMLARQPGAHPAAARFTTQTLQ